MSHPGDLGQEALSTADALLRGAIDLHHHGYPEIALDVRTRHDDRDELRCAADAGMSAIVLKSHMWPTVGRAYHLARAVPDIVVLSSITLNPIAGVFRHWRWSAPRDRVLAPCSCLLGVQRMT